MPFYIQNPYPIKDLFLLSGNKQFHSEITLGVLCGFIESSKIMRRIPSQRTNIFTQQGSHLRLCFWMLLSSDSIVLGHFVSFCYISSFQTMSWQHCSCWMGNDARCMTVWFYCDFSLNFQAVHSNHAFIHVSTSNPCFISLCFPSRCSVQEFRLGHGVVKSVGSFEFPATLRQKVCCHLMTEGWYDQPSGLKVLYHIV